MYVVSLRVPAPVLICKFSDTAKALMDVMSTLASSESASALRWVSVCVYVSVRRVPFNITLFKCSTCVFFLQILSCLSTLLRKQDVTVWSYPSTLQTYHGLLSFTVHSKPKVRAPAHTHRVPYIHNHLAINCFHSPPQIRKAAQHGVCSILRGSDLLFTDNAPTHHPAAAMAAKFCIKEIEQAGGTTPNLWGFFFFVHGFI